MDDHEESKGELIPSEEAQIDLNALIPLGAQFLENSRKESEAKIKFQKESLRLQEKALEQNQSFFRYKYWLLAGIVAAIFGISSGLIFIKNDIASGLSLLTHIGAVIVGIIAGAGWEKLKSK